MNFESGGPGQSWWGVEMWRDMQRGRMKRGFMKFLLLKMLAEGERHGYDFMREFAKRGWGRAGSGTVYPALQWLEENGYVESREEDGKRIYMMTEKGQSFLKEQFGRFGARFAGEEQTQADAPEPSGLRAEADKLWSAIKQASHGSAETKAKVTDLLIRARKEIYTLLANE